MRAKTDYVGHIYGKKELSSIINEQQYQLIKKRRPGDSSDSDSDVSTEVKQRKQDLDRLNDIDKEEHSYSAILHAQ